MEMRVARSRGELEAAIALVHAEYRKRGYVADEGGLGVLLHKALRRAATFVCVETPGVVAATATVVPDSPLGLPMDECYAAEMASLRGHGSCCEVVMLASSSEAFGTRATRSAVPPIFSFFKVLLDYSMRVLAADFMCIAVNPRHAAAFDYILFEPLGGLRSYRSVNGAPAVAKFLDLATLMARLAEPGRERQNAVFGGEATDPSAFEGRFELGARGGSDS